MCGKLLEAGGAPVAAAGAAVVAGDAGTKGAAPSCRAEGFCSSGPTSSGVGAACRSCSESGTCRCCMPQSYDASTPILPCQDHVCLQMVAARVVGAHCGGLCWGSSLRGWRLLLRRLSDAGLRLRCALLLACRNRLLLGGHLCLGGLNSCFCRCGDSSCSRGFVLLNVGSLFLLSWSWLCWLSRCGVRLYRGLLRRRRLHGCCSRSGSCLQERQTLTSSTAKLLSGSQHRQVHDAKEQRPQAVLAARCF